MSEKTATQIMMEDREDRYRLNLRRKRAEAMTVAILSEISRFLDYEDRRRDIYDAIFELLNKEGVEVITDHTRQELGLPPRDGYGWTADEIRAYEMRRLELMMRPFTMLVDPSVLKDS
jgi:hypothetical protein